MNKLYAFMGCLCIMASAAGRTPATVQGRPYGNMTRSEMPDPEPVTLPEKLDFDKVNFWTGEGENRCAVVIQWGLPQEEKALVFGYRWDGDASGADALQSVVENYPGLYGVFENSQYGLTVGGLGRDCNSDGVFTLTSADGHEYKPDASGIFYMSPDVCDNLQATDPADWFSGGWYDGFWSYWVSDEQNDTMSFSQLGSSSSQLTDGCIEGWIFAPDLTPPEEWKEFEYAPAPASSGATDMFAFDDIYYQICSSDGNPAVRVVAPWEPSLPVYSSNVVIPGSVEHDNVIYSVTEIGDGAFKGSALATVTLPSSIERIGSQAFATSSLAEITAEGLRAPECAPDAFSHVIRVVVPASALCAYASADVWKDMNIISAAIGTIFTDTESGVRLRIIAADEAEVTYFTGTSSNPNDYYYNSSFYEGEISVPSAVTFDGMEYAIRSIGKNAFRTSRNLTKITLPESIETIGTGAFADTKTLATVNIPDLVTEIPEDAFDHAIGLSALTGAANVTSIGSGAFMGCVELSSIEGLTKVGNLGDCSFASCSKLVNLPVMPNLKSIGDGALTECSVLKEAILPAGIETIGEVFSSITNYDIVVYTCADNAPNLRSAYTFCVRYFNDNDEPDPIYAPVYVPYGHSASYRNKYIWKNSEIRELTPIVFILRDDMEINSAGVPVFSAVVDCDNEVMEENVPPIFLEANNFSSAAADYAKDVYLEYRKQDLSGIWSVKPGISGTKLSVSLLDLAPGVYEYRWTTDDANQSELTTEWTAFEIEDADNDEVIAIYDFSNAETLDPAPTESDWTQEDSTSKQWNVAGIPFISQGVTVTVADGVKPGFISCIRQSKNSIKTYNGLNMYGPLTITAPEGYVIGSVKVDNDVKYSSFITAFNPDESYLGNLVQNKTEQPYSVTWTADEGMEYPVVKFNTKLNALQSYGNVTIGRMWVTLRKKNVSTRVVSPLADETEETYYNLEGIKIDNPGSGLYIVRRGNEVRKVLIK